MLMLILVACALRSSPRRVFQPTLPPRGSDNVAKYRFDMTQNGQRMTADQFDAWMKANGIHIVKRVSGMPASQMHTTRRSSATP
ncbi:hypothetical protein LPH60_08560 [Xylella taiwanensis]|nr:hypothetical protein [Xylella taiwanensis]MCD8470436.1 hypothetical protein [Xylella taiwanensis]